MVFVKRKFFFIYINEIWFANNFSFFSLFKVSRYLRCKDKKFKFGFFRDTFSTIIIKLDQSLDSIFNNFNSTTRNEIRRVEKDSTILFKTSNDLNLFYGFYNKFAKSKKNLSQFNGIYLLNKNDIMIVTIAAFQFNKEEPDEPMVMHLYLIDYEEKRAVLLNSASLFRYKEFSHLKNKIGMANRFLHFRDMLYFRSLGLSKYDFGGYAINTNDTEKKQINFFKQSFGGEIITEYDYSSFLFFLAKQIQKLLKYVKLSFLN